MRNTTITCDRCRVVIDGEPVVILEPIGSLRAVGRIDLCSECTSELREWLSGATRPKLLEPIDPLSAA